MKYGTQFQAWGKYFDFSDVKTFLRQAKEIGAQVVELYPVGYPLAASMEVTKSIRDCAEALGIEMVFTFGYPDEMDMCSPDPYIRNMAIEHLKKAVRAVHNLGGREIGGILYSKWPAQYHNDMITRNEKRERTLRSIEAVRQVVPVAEELGIQMNLEIVNRFENYIMNTVSEGLEFVRQIDSSSVGLLLDTFHMSLEEEDIPSAIIKAKGYIGKIHVTEPDRNVPFHNTRINWKDIGTALKSIGYDKYVVLEAILAFDDEASYNMRMWRDLIEDTSLEGRMEAVKRGIEFVKAQFGD